MRDFLLGEICLCGAASAACAKDVSVAMHRISSTGVGEKAGTIEELKDVANRAIEQIRERKGLPSAEQARRALYG